MPDTSDRPLSIAGLAAAIGAGGGVSGTGSKPVSVDNLKAVLDQLVVDVLYDGEPVNPVPLSRSMEGYDYVIAEGSIPGNGKRFVIAATPYAAAVGYPVQYMGNVFGISPANISDQTNNSSLISGTQMVSASGSYELLNYPNGDIVRVFGVRFR